VTADGHIEIEWSPGYQGPFEWFGGAPAALVGDYVARMERRYGAARAQQLLFEGPAYALIFPNLFPRRDERGHRAAGDRR
jgi:hypothetical protein